MRKAKRLRAGTVLFGALFICFQGCSAPVTERDPEKVKSELAALERRLIVAVQRKDLDSLNDIWDDQYFGTAPNGSTVTKKDLMEAVKDGVIQLDFIEPEDLYVRLFGDVAVMTGKASVKSKVLDADYAANVRGTGIFVNRGGKWKIAGVHVGPDEAGKPLGEPAR
jgi:ketosteroid isomerase-like protein